MQDNVGLTEIDGTGMQETCTAILSGKGIQHLRFSYGIKTSGSDFSRYAHPSNLAVYNVIPGGPLVDMLKRRHASTLKQLQLYRKHCEYEQPVLLDILKFCPHRQEFVCRWIVSTARLLPPPLFTIPDARTWACAITLRRLTLCIETHLGLYDPKLLQKSVIRHIFRQAEKLTQLTLLLAPFTMPRWAPARIFWDKAIVQEEHGSLGY
ncbi:MAG: hypothetical protein J3R72DRAFT_494593 [Linnemannia gamsii]|nr:MAG: hypothetical protein J3R72DRAFT_494593 [Linnemannia gamsii]